MGIRCTDHVTPLYPQKLALTSPTGGGRSVGIVRWRTKATGLVSLLQHRATDIRKILQPQGLRTNSIPRAHNYWSQPYKTYSPWRGLCIRVKSYMENATLACEPKRGFRIHTWKWIGPF